MNIIFVGILTISVSLLATWILENEISKNKRINKFLVKYQALFSFTLITAILLIPGVLWIIFRGSVSFLTVSAIFIASLLVSIAIAFLLYRYEHFIVNSILESKVDLTEEYTFDDTIPSIKWLANKTLNRIGLESSKGNRFRYIDSQGRQTKEIENINQVIDGLFEG